MRAFPLALLSLLALASPAAAETAAERLLRSADACLGQMSDFDRVVCLQAVLELNEPCTGKVEERLVCLESRIAKQAREIVRLRYELDKLNRPRVQPLDGPYLSER